MKKIALLVLLPALYFGFINSLWSYNPAMIFDSPREYLGLEINVLADLDQNLFNLEDASKLIGGETLVIDKTRLETMEHGFILSPVLGSKGTLWIGSRSFKLGAAVSLDGDLDMKLPPELMNVIFGNVDYDENIDKDFGMFSGGIYAKLGALIGFSFKNFELALEGGVYSPILWFDENSKAHFYYRSDKDEGRVETGVNVSVRLFSIVSSLEDLEEMDLTENAGYYIDLGVLANFGKLKVSAGVKNITLSSAKLGYEGYANVSFAATYSNFELETDDPSFEISKEFTALPEPTSVEIPLELNGAISYDLSFLKLGTHLRYLIDSGYKEYGAYLSLLDLLWIDFTGNDLAWKKTIGLNIDLRLIRITAVAGVIDYGGILNFDPSKMTGLSVSVGAGLGF